MKIREFQTKLWLPLEPEAVFRFFSDAANLESITPPWLNFKIATPLPIVMAAGTLIDYRLRVRGIPLRWRTRINVWEPPYRFEDEQLKGPYQHWIHEHTFTPHDGGTLAQDRVRYATPLDWLVHDQLVRPDIERIFQFRSEVLAKQLSHSAPPTKTCFTSAGIPNS